LKQDLLPSQTALRLNYGNTKCKLQYIHGPKRCAKHESRQH